MKTVYGPVSSWRLGRSLGIDLICSSKMCSFNCTYCQLGGGIKIFERREFVSLDQLKKDCKSIKLAKADMITFSGTGEPTLALNLGSAIKHIRSITKLPLAILTNASLLWDVDVIDCLNKLDVVVAKLDAPNAEAFKEINSPHEGITFDKYIGHMKAFRIKYSGKFALQIMFTNSNKDQAYELAELAQELDPDEVQINTPLRPSAVKPLSIEELVRIKDIFSGFGFRNITSVYDVKKPEVDPIDLCEVRLRKRPEP